MLAGYMCQEEFRGPKDHINLRILQTLVSGFLFLFWPLEPAFRILVFMWSWGPVQSVVKVAKDP